MNKENLYLFKSERLGFRNWIASDIPLLSEINRDKEVMEFFPGTVSEFQTKAFIEKMQKIFLEKKHCYFAVDKLADQEFIGFIGISEQTFEADFTPCVDIGWRLKKTEWNKGFATEGALRCIDYAFTVLKLEKIYAIAPIVNKKSAHVMLKIGMKKVSEFLHPSLSNQPRLQNCVLYEITQKSK